jgi:hypothetical protein
VNLSRLLIGAALAASTCAVALPAHAAPADKKDKDDAKPSATATATPGQGNGNGGQGKGNAGQSNGNAGQGNGNAGQGNTNSGQDNTNSGQDNTNSGQGNTNSGQANANAGQGNTGAPPAAATPGTPEETPAELAPVAPPVAGRSVAATVTGGAVRVLLPGNDAYVPLSDAASMPVGSVVDARHGAVVMQVALPGKPAETVSFSGSMFELRQGKHATTVRLRGGDFGKCAPDTRTFAMVASGKKRKSPVVRSLWASDHGGHFRTHGHNSVATVRGTTWLTEDRCDGTLTRVTSGAVEVYDRSTERKVLVRAGHSYLARHP